MASISPIISLHLFSLLLLAHFALSDHSPAHPPALPPADELSPPPATAPSPSISSPPAPPPSDLAPKPHSPAPTPHDKSPSPAPSPSLPPAADAGDINRETESNAADLESKESSGGMSGGQKVGVAIGVIAGACIVGAGALVYKKRQRNIQRSQFGSAARRDIL